MKDQYEPLAVCNVCVRCYKFHVTIFFVLKLYPSVILHHVYHMSAVYRRRRHCLMSSVYIQVRGKRRRL
jgi:hypothetical protein